MADKSLKSKAVDIKGKQYVLVADRVVYFNETYPNGSIVTKYEFANGTYHFGAIVTPDTEKPLRKFTGHSQATIGEGMVNKTAAMENAETSAVGRALAMMGIGVIESIASADEMNKAQAPTVQKRRRASINQIKLMANKVQWAKQDYDRDNILNYLDKVLGKSVTEVMADEVDEALAKIDQALREDKLQDKLDDKPSENPDPVIDISPEDENKLMEGTLLDDIPY